MATSYKPQTAQMNEEPTPKSSLNLTLMQYPRDENPEHERCALILNWSPQAWYYCIFSNFRTFVILWQVDPVFSDELEIIYESYYEIKDTFIFAWFSILDIRHYHWFRNPIRCLLLNSKTDYLVRNIWCILDIL